ncbi:hypothetical protein AB0I72_19845 [Nocardiopsis sp. NPDC049922]|uniref:hypothetical protein n=1 Tax=Nocardiopsis sp. NPDC049922 TaxID=3155157 RepID=UPI0033C0E3ED
MTGPCRHEAAVPVDSVVTGTTLAYLCPDCGTQLPDDFGAELAARRALTARQAACPHTQETADITQWGGSTIARLCQTCGKTLSPPHTT